MLRITSVQRSVQSKGKTFCYLNRNMDRGRERQCVLERRHQVDCSTAAVNSDCVRLERAEGIHLVCPVAQGHGKWKNEHVMYRLSHCFKCVCATTASHLG